jgi:hypothetical protein
LVAIAAEPTGDGYLLVTAKGNVYHFGHAAWHGSSASSVPHLSSPMVGIATSRPPRPGSSRPVTMWSAPTGDVYNYGMFLPGSPKVLPPPAPIDGMGAN